MGDIRGFNREDSKYHYMSNLALCPIEYKVGGAVLAFPSIEHLYQCIKCTDEREFWRVYNTHHPIQARRMGRGVQYDAPYWYKYRASIMRACIEIKFKQHDRIARLLSATQGDIIEDSNIKDSFWGIGSGTGRNILGHILMDIRDSLRIQTSI